MHTLHQSSFCDLESIVYYAPARHKASCESFLVLRHLLQPAHRGDEPGRAGPAGDGVRRQRRLAVPPAELHAACALDQPAAHHPPEVVHGVGRGVEAQRILK